MMLRRYLIETLSGLLANIVALCTPRLHVVERVVQVLRLSTDSEYETLGHAPVKNVSSQTPGKSSEV